MTNDKSGRPRVRLWKNGKSERFIISRLVANAFIPNPENKPEVKHIDGNTSNNAVSNLKWSNHKELYEIADKMFKELGYKKIEKGSGWSSYFKYYKDDDNVFYFDDDDKTFAKGGEHSACHDHITMEELKAINKKCLELRMDRGVINNVYSETKCKNQR